MIDKQSIPEVSTILSDLLSPDDIISAKNMESYTTLADANTKTLLDEITRRKKLDGLKEALENEDFDRLGEVFKDMYGEDLVSTGKKLLITTLAVKGLKVEDEIHIEETVGDWIENTYETKGIKGLLDWTTQIDVALQVVDEYKVIFESEQAKEHNRKDQVANYFDVLRPIAWNNPFRE